MAGKKKTDVHALRIFMMRLARKLRDRYKLNDRQIHMAVRALRQCKTRQEVRRKYKEYVAQARKQRGLI